MLYVCCKLINCKSLIYDNIPSYRKLMLSCLHQFQICKIRYNYFKLEKYALDLEVIVGHNVKLNYEFIHQKKNLIWKYNIVELIMY